MAWKTGRVLPVLIVSMVASGLQMSGGSEQAVREKAAALPGHLPAVHRVPVRDAPVPPEGPRANPPDMPGWPVVIDDNHWYSEGPSFVEADGDPELEILVTTALMVHLLNTDASYLDGWPVTITQGHHMVGGAALGDLDGDGEGEVVFVTDDWPVGQRGWTWAVHLGGSPVTGFPYLTNGAHTKSPTVVDLDGDGSSEIIIAEVLGEDSGRVHVLAGDGSLLPGWPRDLNEVPSSSTAAADLDGDGILEIVDTSLLSVYAFPLDGSLVDGFPFTPNNGDHFWSAVALADVDGDGVAEIAVGGFQDPLVPWNNGMYLLDGDGSLMPGWPRYLKYWARSGPAFADLTGDGVPELIQGDVTFSINNDFSVYAWHADGTPVPGWGLENQYPVQCQVIVGDIDGDGDPELIWDDPREHIPTDTGWLHGAHHDGTPLAGWPLTTTGGTAATSPALGDADGDGDLELLCQAHDFDGLFNTIYLWDLPDPASTSEIQVPMFQYDPGRSGHLTAAPAGLIFADGFESGDTSQWPTVVR